MEGWLKKKCHHIGLWKYRFFRFDGKVLRYWKRKHQADSDQPPRGEFSLTRCHTFPAQDQGLVIRAPHRAFDEELLAATCEERNAWVRLLNAAALQHRLSVASCQPSTERFLRSNGLWEVLEGALDAAADVAVLGPATAATPLSRAASEALPTTPESVASTCCCGEDAVLRHVHFGSVLLQISDKPLAPRQGRFVEAGRRAWQNMRWKGTADEPLVEKGCSESWVLLASVRSLAPDAPVGPLFRAGAFYKHVDEQPPCGGLAEGTPLLEALHAWRDPLDESPPFASLPLARCRVSTEEECLDGSGWSIYLENKAECDSRPCTWTLVVGTREECAHWRRAIDVAIWAARAREAGRLRLAEEALHIFDDRRGLWRGALSRRLAEVAADVPARRMGHATASWASRSFTVEDQKDPGEASVALRRVLAACGEVCEDACDMLDAALSQTPLRRDICEVALEAAIDPAVAHTGRWWSRFTPVLSHGDGRALLRWLDAQRQAQHRLGLLHTPLDAAVSGLSVELSLRMGAHLRRIALQLLVREFGEAMRARAPTSPGGGQAAGPSSPPPSRRPSIEGAGGAPQSPRPFREQAQSTLPVDLFTMVFSCLPFDRDQDVLALRLSSQRVAKFIVYELQKVIWSWLVATLPEVHREIKSKQMAGGASELCLPWRALQWLACVSALANGAPAFAAQCRDLGAVPLHVAGDRSARLCEPSRTFVGPDGSELGPETLPPEWGLAAEEQRFEALQEAALWAACDVASARWRRLALSSAPELSTDASVSNVGVLLKAQLDGPVSGLRGWLEPSVFRKLLPKLFHVCLAGYILRLSRGLWFQPPLAGEPTEMACFQLSEDTVHFCRYFQALAGGSAALRGGDPWEPGRVLTRLHAVLSLASSHQKCRPAPTPRLQQPFGPEIPGTQKDGLGSLVAALSDGPLPLHEVMAWFGARPPLDPFDELPPPVPWGGQFISNVQLGSPCLSRRCSTPALGRHPSQDSLGKQVGQAKGQRKRISMPSLKLYGKVPEQFFDPLNPTPSEPSSRAGGVEVVEEGNVCELQVQELGAYGVFCGILRQFEGAPSGGGSFASASSSSSFGTGPGSGAPPMQPRPRRRWAQLARRAVGQAPTFEVLSSMPEGLQDNNVQALLSLPLTHLAEACPQGATALSLLFRNGDGGIDESEEGINEAGEKEQSSRSQLRYHIFFDCPSHLFRWRLVLEAWASLSIPTLQPIVSLGGSSANRLLSGWEDLPQNLTQEVLEQRLGGLWADVRLSLQAGGAAAPRTSAAA